MLIIGSTCRTKSGLIVAEFKLSELENTVYSVLDIEGRYRFIRWNRNTGKVVFPWNDKFDLIIDPIS